MPKLTNLIGLAALIGAFDKKINRAFMLAQNMPHAGYYGCYAGRPNQRRKRKEMRRTVFANRRIARGF